MGQHQSTLVPHLFDPRPFIPSVINNSVVFFLYDTGSKESFLDISLFQQLNIEGTNKVYKTKYMSNGFGQIKTVHYFICDVEVKFHQKTITSKFTVYSNKQCPAVLGIDFINFNKLSYCPVTKTFKFILETLV